MDAFSLDLDSFFHNCLQSLIHGTKHEVEYKDLVDHKNKINTLPASLPSTVNVYALWERPAGGSDWILRYVGQRESREGYRRLHQHLFDCPEKTQSKRDKVAAALFAGSSIAVSAIFVSPEPLRLAVEEWVLRNLKERPPTWNKKLRADQGLGRRRRPIAAPA